MLAKLRTSAHYRREQHGGVHGFDVEDWLQAEKEMSGYFF